MFLVSDIFSIIQKLTERVYIGDVFAFVHESFSVINYYYVMALNSYTSQYAQILEKGIHVIKHYLINQ